MDNCKIVRKIKLKKTEPVFWCLQHGSSATGKFGVKLKECENAHLDLKGASVKEIDIDSFKGGIGLWGAVKPVFDTTENETIEGIHVHARPEISDEKEIDETFDAVVIKWKDDLFKQETATINRQAAIAYFIGKTFKRKMDYLFCDHCGHVHLDAERFAVKHHKKHLCHNCNKEFRDTKKVVSNPILLVRKLLNQEDEKIIEAEEDLSISLKDFKGGVKIWASNPALVWTAPRPEWKGIHVHAFKEEMEPNFFDFIEPDLDETYRKVRIEGVLLNEEQTRIYMAQSALQFLRNKIVVLDCPKCKNPHFDQNESAFTPHKTHVCENCGEVFETSLNRKKLVVSNPIIKTFKEIKKLAK